MARGKFIEIGTSRRDCPKVVTPVGTAVFPRLNTPDTKFNPDGEYTVKLRLAAADAKPLLDKMASFMDEAFERFIEENPGKAKTKRHALPAKAATNREGEEIPGFVDINFKRRASGATRDGGKWEAKIGLFDAAGKPITDEVWGGSELRVQCRLVPWYTPALGFGVRGELLAAQIVKLVGPGGDVTAEQCGFGEIEGYVAPEKDAEAPDTDDDGTDDDPDF